MKISSKLKVYFACLNHPSFTLLPYPWGLLRAYAELSDVIKASYQFIDAFYGRPKVDTVLSKIEEPAVFGITCYVWNMNLSMQIASRVKTKYPDCTIIAGGPHIPDKTAGFFNAHPYIDILVHHEGEIAFQSILIELLSKKVNLTKISGITFNDNGVEKNTGPSESLSRDLSIPSPYLLGYFENMFDDFRSNQNYGLSAIWETNRGCPYKCTFCDWGDAYFQKLKQADIEKLKDEIEYFGSNGFNLIYSADANFGLIEKDLALAKKLASVKKNYGSPKQFWTNDAKFANDRVFEINKILYQANLNQGATLSMQSLNADTLKAIKRPSYSTEKYGEIKKEYKENNIPTYTELILGMPNETKNTWTRGYGRLLETGHHEDIRFYHASLLPNSELSSTESRKRYGIKSVIKKIFFEEECEILIGTKSLSPEDWVECNIFSYLIRTLHCGGYTKYLSMYLNRQYGVPYDEFYLTLQQKFQTTPNSVLGAIQREIEQAHILYINDRGSNDPVTFPFWKMSMYGNQTALKIPPYIYSTHALPWIWINSRIEEAYAEIKSIISINFSEYFDDCLIDLLRFQQDTMITIEYDGKGLTKEYEYDWYNYFFNKAPLNHRNINISFNDTGLGPNNVPFISGNPRVFLEATLGPMLGFFGYRRFFHQPDQMKYILSK